VNAFPGGSQAAGVSYQPPVLRGEVTEGGAGLGVLGAAIGVGSGSQHARLVDKVT
jgi:hypothetical protein